MIKYSPFLLITLLLLSSCNQNPAWAQEPDWDKIVPIIIQIESNGNPSAYNKKSGATGLMRITPIVLFEYPYDEEISSKKDLFDPEKNIKVGTWYLKRIWYHYLKGKGTLEDMLICYNFGYGNWLKYKQGKIKLPKETRDYLSKYKKLAEKK